MRVCTVIIALLLVFGVSLAKDIVSMPEVDMMGPGGVEAAYIYWRNPGGAPIGHLAQNADAMGGAEGRDTFPDDGVVVSQHHCRSCYFRHDTPSVSAGSGRLTERAGRAGMRRKGSSPAPCRGTFPRPFREWPPLVPTERASLPRSNSRVMWDLPWATISTTARKRRSAPRRTCGRHIGSARLETRRDRLPVG